MRALKLLILLFVLAPVLAHAAKIPVSWQNATLNDDGTPMTLKAVRLEWGTCSGNSFLTAQASILVPAPASSAAIYPTGINPVCIHACSIRDDDVRSDATPTLVHTLPGPLQKPVTLAKPIVLPPRSP